MWQANITIQNNTDYNLTVDGVGPGNTTIGPNSETQWERERERERETRAMPAKSTQIHKCDAGC